jgi:hypothetical protein
LEHGVDSGGEGIGIGGLLLASQEKQMVALDGIQTKNFCETLQDLRGNRNSATLFEKAITRLDKRCPP